MKTFAETEIQYIDPLTYKPINEGERVTLNTDSGIAKDFKVVSIEKNDSLVLGPLNSKSSKLVKGSNIGESIEIKAFNLFQNRKLKSDEKVLVQVRNFKQPYWVDTILNNGVIVLRPTEVKKKLGLLDRLFYIKKSITG